jgi:hypothetical protein
MTLQLNFEQCIYYISLIPYSFPRIKLYFMSTFTLHCYHHYHHHHVITTSVIDLWVELFILFIPQHGRISSCLNIISRLAPWLLSATHVSVSMHEVYFLYPLKNNQFNCEWPQKNQGIGLLILSSSSPRNSTSRTQIIKKR